MGKRLSQLNQVDRIEKEDYLLVDGEEYLESKKIALKDIDINNFNTEKFKESFVKKEDGKGLSSNDFTDNDKNKLDASQEKLISGSNIKTINGQSILGEGNIEVQGGGSVTPVGDLVGQKTTEGGEIFNDYENNQSISEFSSARGTHTFVGTKFFYIIDKNEINKTYTLKDYYLDISSSGELAVNDLFSITTGGNREDCGTIESITQEEGTNNAIVTVSNWYWDNSSSLTEPTYDNPSTSFIFRVIDKPLCGTDIMGIGASSEGYSTKALMIGCHSEGYFTIAGGKYSHAEGRETRAGYAAHAEGWGTKAMGQDAHSEGHFTDAQGWYSHSEGNNTKSIGQSSHAEGANTEASGSQAHAEGSNTLASNFNTHAEGNNTQATKNEAHAEGLNTTASGSASHAEGEGTTASSYSSHAEGENTTASGYSSHAEGGNTVASGGYSHAGGLGTIASGSSQTSIGKYNREDVNALLIVGNGSGPSATERSNAFTVNSNGTATVQTNPIEDMDVANKGYVDNLVGSVETALDSIIAMQEELIGGASE